MKNSSPQSPGSTQRTSTSDDPFDYEEWYNSPGNSIRRWDEEHGVRLVRNPNNGMLEFLADPKMLFGVENAVVTYPEYFKDRTLDRFEITLYPVGPNRDMAKSALLKTRKYIEEYSTIINEFYGCGLYYFSRERGTGKTWLSTILGNELSKRGHRVRWYSMTNLIQEIKSGFDRDSATSSSEIIEIAKRAEILMLDDIGVEKQSAWLNETVYSILDYRMTTCKPTIFTSNLTPDQLSYDERIVDRIRRMTEMIELPNISIRKILNQQNRLGSFLST